MKTYTVKVKPNSGAFFGIEKWAGTPVVIDMINATEAFETYEIKTPVNIDGFLNAAPGVIDFDYTEE
jgi:hypothetical protein